MVWLHRQSIFEFGFGRRKQPDYKEMSKAQTSDSCASCTCTKVVNCRSYGGIGLQISSLKEIVMIQRRSCRVVVLAGQTLLTGRMTSLALSTAARMPWNCHGLRSQVKHKRYYYRGGRSFVIFVEIRPRRLVGEYTSTPSVQLSHVAGSAWAWSICLQTN